MTTILRFIQFFLLAPAFAIVAQAAGAVQDDFRVVDAGLQTESIVLESADGGNCNYDTSGALLQQRSSLDGKGDDGDDLSGREALATSGAARPLFSFLAEFVATNNPFIRGGDITTSPWLADRRAGVVSHLEDFRSGGSYLVPRSVYERRILGQSQIGRPDGQFITTRQAIDDLLVEAGGDLSVVKRRLGIPDEYWNEELLRVDIFEPLMHNGRLPSGLEAGANPLFRWGGYTSGGLPEIAIDQIPIGGFRVTPTGVGP